MIATTERLEIQDLVRREIAAHARGPQFNSHQTPRGTTQNRVARYLSERLPMNPRELDEVTLLVEGQPIPLLRYNGRWHPLGPAPLVTAMPANPFDGMTVGYIADATDGVVWTFRYNAASASSYPWEYVGGSAMREENTATGMTTSSASFVDLSTPGPSITTPLTGDYRALLHWVASHTIATAFGVMAVKIGGASAADVDGVIGQNGAANTHWVSTGKVKLDGITAGTVLKCQYRTGSGATMTVGNATTGPIFFELTPVRVG